MVSLVTGEPLNNNNPAYSTMKVPFHSFTSSFIHEFHPFMPPILSRSTWAFHLCFLRGDLTPLPSLKRVFLHMASLPAAFKHASFFSLMRKQRANFLRHKKRNNLVRSSTSPYVYCPSLFFSSQPNSLKELVPAASVSHLPVSSTLSSNQASLPAAVCEWPSPPTSPSVPWSDTDHPTRCL